MKEIILLPQPRHLTRQAGQLDHRSGSPDIVGWAGGDGAPGHGGPAAGDIAISRRCFLGSGRRHGGAASPGWGNAQRGNRGDQS